MSHVLEIKDLGRDYGDKKALREVSLQLDEGDIFGLVGPNGAGKTTLIKTIVGLLAPSSGRAMVFGRDIRRLGNDDRRRLGYIADEPFLYEYMTAKEHLRFNRGFHPDWDDDRSRRYLERMHLPMDEKIKSFSRGMKVQLALVLALAPLPDLLLLDEPMDGLDPLVRLNVLNLLLEEFMDGRRTMLISSHHLGELERIADRVGFLKEGRLVKVVPIEHLQAEEKTIRVVFQREPPPGILDMSGIKSVEREGATGYLIAVEDNFKAIYEACAGFPHFVLDVYHRDLEDLFRDIAGGEHDDV